MNDQNPYAAPQSPNLARTPTNDGDVMRKAVSVSEQRHRFAQWCIRSLVYPLIITLLLPLLLSPFVFLFLVVLLANDRGLVVLPGLYMLPTWLVWRLSIYPAIWPRRLFVSAAAWMVCVPWLGVLAYKTMDLSRDNFFTMFYFENLVALSLILVAFSMIARQERQGWLQLLNLVGIAYLLGATLFLKYADFFSTQLPPLAVLLMDLGFGSQLKERAEDS